MGKKEYEHAAAYVRKIRTEKKHGELTEGIASNVEDAFLNLFNRFDSKGVFNRTRFMEACKEKK